MKSLRMLPAGLIAVLLTSVASAAPVTIGQDETLASKILNEERTLSISLPRGYEGSQASYPVLYLLDSETRFHHATGTAASLAVSGHIPELIVVGIHNTNRTRDLTPPWTHEEQPTDRAQVIAAGQGADNFLRFIKEELIPHVEQTYRTAPYRILVGHSFGGLFAVHAFVTDPDLFQATLAISPSLWWDDGHSVQQARELFRARPKLARHLYLTMGTEGGDMLAQFQNLDTVLRYEAPVGLSWEAHVLDIEDHGSIPIPAVHSGLKSFFPRWQVPPFAREDGLAGIDRHFANLSKEYGYPLATPEGLINNLGYGALGSQEIEKAIALFRTNTERHPGSANVYDSLGEALEAAGQLAEARQHYQKAIDLGQDRNDPNLGAYRGHLEAVTAKLEPGK